MRTDISYLINPLVERRKEKKITQTEMAETLGISRPNLWRYETCRLPMSLDVYAKYAETLALDIKYMLK